MTASRFSILHGDHCPCREKGCPVDARRDPCWTSNCYLVELVDAPESTVVEDLTITPVDVEEELDVDDSLDGACLCHDAAICPDTLGDVDLIGYEDRGLDARYEDRYDR